jgi:hypothetical protein
MLAALRSRDPELIARYSDLSIPDIDKKILALSAKIDEAKASQDHIRTAMAAMSRPSACITCLWGWTVILN